MDLTTFTGAWGESGPTTPVIGWAYRMGIAPLLIVSEADSELAVRPDSVVEKPLAAEDLLGVEKPAVAEKPLVEMLPRDGRSLQPIGAVIAPLAEFRTEAPRGCRAITDSPA